MPDVNMKSRLFESHVRILRLDGSRPEGRDTREAERISTIELPPLKLPGSQPDVARPSRRRPGWYATGVMVGLAACLMVMLWTRTRVDESLTVAKGPMQTWV